MGTKLETPAQTAVRLEADQLKAATKLAVHHGVMRSEILRQAITLGLAQLKTMATLPPRANRPAKHYVLRRVTKTAPKTTRAKAAKPKAKSKKA